MDKEFIVGVVPNLCCSQQVPMGLRSLDYLGQIIVEIKGARKVKKEGLRSPPFFY